MPGRLGVSLVRRLGPGLPRGHDGAGGRPFAKKQVIYMLSSLYQHPHGEVPAYEWDFSNTNPPVLAWATWQIYVLDAAPLGKPDIGFLATAYRGLLSCLNSWLNTKDPLGRTCTPAASWGWTTSGIQPRPSAAHRWQPGAERRHPPGWRI